MALFPRCNNPVPVSGRHGVTLVGCHSCIQCRVAAQERLCKILEVEASKHKYVEFLTNTYDDLHLPYIDTSYMYPFSSHNSNNSLSAFSNGIISSIVT